MKLITVNVFVFLCIKQQHSHYQYYLPVFFLFIFTFPSTCLSTTTTDTTNSTAELMILEAVFVVTSTHIGNWTFFNANLKPFFEAANASLELSTVLQIHYEEDNTVPTNIVQVPLFLEAVVVVSSFDAPVFLSPAGDHGITTNNIAALLKNTLALFSAAVFLGEAAAADENLLSTTMPTTNVIAAILAEYDNVQAAAATTVPFNITAMSDHQCVLSSFNDTAITMINCVLLDPLDEKSSCVCLPGFFYKNSSSTEASQCIACAAGFYKPDYDDDDDDDNSTSKPACQACEAGWSTLGLEGQRTCWACPPNMSTRGLTGQASCSACGNLQVAPDWGSSDCLCVAGIFYFYFYFYLYVKLTCCDGKRSCS